MPYGKTICVTGSRLHTDRELIHAAIVANTPIACMINGDGHGDPGADALALEIAEELLMPTKRFPAEWSRYGNPIAAHKRNQAMIDEEPDLVLAFPLRGSRGTWDTVRRALMAKIPVQVWLRPPSSVQVPAYLYQERREREHFAIRWHTTHPDE